MESFNRTTMKRVMLFGLALLSGCYSFNTTIINNPKNDESVKETTSKYNKDMGVAKVDDVGSIPLCPIFILPELAPAPELPIKQLEAINPSNTKAIDKLERDHIIELRRYIITTRQFIRNEHNKYLKECSEYITKK